MLQTRLGANCSGECTPEKAGSKNELEAPSTGSKIAPTLFSRLTGSNTPGAIFCASSTPGAIFEGGGNSK